MRRGTIAAACLVIIAATCYSQSKNASEEFEYNRHLIKSTRSIEPKNGLVPDRTTAIAIAYAVALPVYGEKEMDNEKPFRAELDHGVWTILGTLHCTSCVGGTLVMQIDKASGKILFMTHTQ